MQVADFSAVAFGLVVVLWFCGVTQKRFTLTALIATGAMLVLTHTRTALIALMAGLLVAGLRLFMTEARVRRLFAVAGVTLSFAVVVFSGVLTTWLARGENAQELTKLTGRTNVWGAVASAPRDEFQVIFGYGLSNKSFNGLPIDSNWLAAYFDLGLVGVTICAALLLFVLVHAYFQPPQSAARPRPVPRDVPPRDITDRDRAQRRIGVPARARPGRVAARTADRAKGKTAGMRILQIHNRYRSAAPSGENRVVDQEHEALAALGHEVMRFERNSDEIGSGPWRRRLRCRPGSSGAGKPTAILKRS